MTTPVFKWRFSWFFRLAGQQLLPIFVALFLLKTVPVSAEDLRIGYVGSLTGFAGNYGTAVLEGAKLAVEDLEKDGVTIAFIAEDDQSIMKNTVAAYTKLHTVDQVDAIVGGSWWLNAIAKQAERHGVLLMSCETQFNKDYVRAKSYFTLGGDIRDWVRIFIPVIEKENLRSAAMVKFVSGFSDTLAEEMERIFTDEGRAFVGSLEYTDVQMQEAATLVTKLSRRDPDAVYVDAQPTSFSVFLDRLSQQGQTRAALFTHVVARDAIQQGLVDPGQVKNPLYFSARAGFDPEFQERFAARYGKKPSLNADLGYYAVLLLAAALQSEQGSPIAALQEGLSVRGKRFEFDSNNVWSGIPHRVWTIRDGKVVPTAETDL